MRKKPEPPVALPPDISDVPTAAPLSFEENLLAVTTADQLGKVGHLLAIFILKLIHKAYNERDKNSKMSPNMNSLI